MKKVITLIAIAICLLSLSVYAQQPDTSQKIRQVYYSDIILSQRIIGEVEKKIHSPNVSKLISASTRDSIDLFLSHAIDPILQRIPAVTTLPDPEKNKKPVKKP